MTLRHLADGLQDFQQWASDPRPRVGLGLPFFDVPTNGGMAKAECAMVLAYSSVGKTTIALNAIARNPQVPCVFFSLEMSWRQVSARLTAIDTGIPTWELEKLLKGGDKVHQVTEVGYRYPVLLGDDRSELDLKSMKQAVLEAGQKVGQPVGLIVIDYLELIGGAGMLGKSEQVDRAAQKIRSLAKDCDTRVLVLHQVAKTDGSGGHEPLSLDSGKFGGHHPMDYVIGAYAPRLNRQLTEQQRENCQTELYLQLLKNRNGKANPSGVRHFQDPQTGVVKPWGSTQVIIPGVTPYQPTMEVSA